MGEEREEVWPPTNFSVVESGLYRSSYPTMKSFGFLKKLKLKSILTLVVEEYPEKNLEFIKKNGIELIQIGLRPNKEPFVEVQKDKIILALQKILDVRNHPMLIHCNSGKHRTGTVIGCVRKIQKWCLSSIFAEYIRFSFPNSLNYLIQMKCFGTSRMNTCRNGLEVVSPFVVLKFNSCSKK